MTPEQTRAMDYLARKGTGASAETLRTQLGKAFAAVEELFDQVREDERSRRPAADKWSAHEILDHLVLSHGPAIPQFESLLSGIDSEGTAVPADLHTDDDQRAPWTDLRDRLAAIHRAFLASMATATDDVSLAPKAEVEIVVKVDGRPLHWFERLDWKAFIQAIRVHTIEHHNQLQRTLDTIRG